MITNWLIIYKYKEEELRISLIKGRFVTLVAQWEYVCLLLIENLIKVRECSSPVVVIFSQPQ